MKGIRKNLFYWIEVYEKNFLLLLFTMLVTSLLLAFFDERGLQESFLHIFQANLIWVAIISIIANSLNSVNCYFPLTISMGSTRHCSFVAMQIAQYLVVIESMVLMYLLQCPMEYPLLYVGSAFLLMGIGQMLGVIVLRFGRSVAAITFLVLLFSIIAIVGIVIIADVNNTIVIKDFKRIFLQTPLFLGAGIVFNILLTGIFYKVIRKADLSFV